MNRKPTTETFYSQQVTIKQQRNTCIRVIQLKTIANAYDFSTNRYANVMTGGEGIYTAKTLIFNKMFFQ